MQRSTARNASLSAARVPDRLRPPRRLRRTLPARLGAGAQLRLAPGAGSGRRVALDHRRQPAGAVSLRRRRLHDRQGRAAVFRGRRAIHHAVPQRRYGRPDRRCLYLAPPRHLQARGQEQPHCTASTSSARRRLQDGVGGTTRTSILSLDFLWATLLLYFLVMKKPQIAKDQGRQHRPALRQGHRPEKPPPGARVSEVRLGRLPLQPHPHFIDYRKHFADIPLLLERETQ